MAQKVWFVSVRNVPLFTTGISGIQQRSATAMLLAL
jgi:hypothetical protein